MVKSIIVSTYITVALPLFPHVEPQPHQVELTCANNDGDYLDSDGMRVSNGWILKLACPWYFVIITSCDHLTVFKPAINEVGLILHQRKKKNGTIYNIIYY